MYSQEPQPKAPLARTPRMRFHLQHPRTLLSAWALSASLSVMGQGVFAVHGSPGWTQQWAKTNEGSAILELAITPTIEGAALRKGFQIRIHQDNALWEQVEHSGRRPVRFKLPPNHLYTIELSHEAAYQKVLQIDVEGMTSNMELECHIDLMLRPDLSELTFEDQLVLSTPLSVIWFDKKRNLFRHDAYMHGDGIEQLRNHLKLRDPSLHAPPD